MVIKLFLVGVLLLISGCCDETPVLAEAISPTTDAQIEQLQDRMNHLANLVVIEAQRIIELQDQVVKLESEDLYINEVAQEAVKK